MNMWYVCNEVVVKRNKPINVSINVSSYIIWLFFDNALHDGRNVWKKENERTADILKYSNGRGVIKHNDKR